MNEIVLNTPYAPSMAEDGKFVVIDPTTLSTLGLSVTGSIGRFAVLTYSIGGSTMITPSSGTKLTPNSRDKYKFVTATPVATAIALQTNTQLIELYNEGPQPIYFDFSNNTNFATLSTDGMILASGSFYSIEMNAEYISIGSAAATVRLFNYYSNY